MCLFASAVILTVTIDLVPQECHEKGPAVARVGATETCQAAPRALLDMKYTWVYRLNLQGTVPSLCLP